MAFLGPYLEYYANKAKATNTQIFFIYSALCLSAEDFSPNLLNTEHFLILAHHSCSSSSYKYTNIFYVLLLLSFFNQTI